MARTRTRTRTRTLSVRLSKWEIDLLLTGLGKLQLNDYSILEQVVIRLLYERFRELSNSPKLQD